MVKMQKKNPIMSWSIQAQLEWRKINQVTDRLKQNTPNTTPKYKLSIIQINLFATEVIEIPQKHVKKIYSRDGIFHWNSPKLEGFNFSSFFCFKAGHVFFLEMPHFQCVFSLTIFRVRWEK